jgi:hypothetical protein
MNKFKVILINLINTFRNLVILKMISKVKNINPLRDLLPLKKQKEIKVKMRKKKKNKVQKEFVLKILAPYSKQKESF